MIASLKVSKTEFYEKVMKQVGEGDMITFNIDEVNRNTINKVGNEYITIDEFAKSTNSRFERMTILKHQFEMWHDYNINYVKSVFVNSDSELNIYNDNSDLILIDFSDKFFLIDGTFIKSFIIKKVKNLHKLLNRLEFYEENITRNSLANYNVVIPNEIFENTRGYFEKIAIQINLCYQYGLYDAFLVLARKLIESLIIESFEKFKIEDKIKNNKDDYFSLSNLLSIYLSTSEWNLSRNSKAAIPKIKKIADLSAHNSKFNAQKADIDSIKIEIRVLLEEMVHILDFKTTK